MNAKTLLPSVLTALAVATGATLTSGALAADLTVDYGQSVTIDANATYDTVTVNGDLTVAQGVTLTINTYLYVSKDNGGNRATLTVGPNATVNVNISAGSDADVADIGYDSPATVTLQSGATLSGVTMNLARNISAAASDGQLPVEIIVNDAAVLLSGILRCRGAWNNNETSVICLNGSNATLSPKKQSVVGNNQRTRIRFNGGIVKFTLWDTGGNIYLPNASQQLALESVDGNPIRLYFTTGNAGALFRSVYSNTIVSSGNGALQVESPTSSLQEFARLEGSNANFSFGHTGGFRILASARMKFDAKTAAAISAMTSGNNDFTVEVGGIVDLNGNGLTLDSIQSAGTITNTSATAATLTVGANGGDAVFGIAPSVPVVKTGAGALRIPEGDLDSVSVQEGTLDLCDRAAVGYPYYRFWMRAKKSDVNYTGISEFALYNGASEVTSRRTAASQVLNGGYIFGNAGHVFDRDFTTAWRDGALGKTDNHALNWRTNRMDFVVHFGNAPSFKFSYPNDTDNGVPHADETATEYPNLAAPDRPSPLQSVSAYTFAYCDGNSGGLNATPTEWYFQGAMKGNEWRDLDHVVGYNTAGGTAGAWCGTNFVVKCGVSSVAVDSLSVANGATWAIDLSQIDIDVGTLTAGGAATLVVSGVTNPKGNVELPVSVGALSGGLSSWRMTFPEHPGVERGVCLEGGTLCATSVPTVIYMREGRKTTCSINPLTFIKALMRKMKAITSFLVSFCAAAMVVVAGEPPPPRQMTLRCGGSVRLPESPAGFTPTISIDGSSSFSDFVAVGETPATPDGVSYDFIRQGRKPPASGRATLAPNADGTLTARWTFTLNEDAAKVECGVSLRLPHSDFPRESFAVENGAVKIDGMVARFGGTPPSVSNGFGGWPYAPYWFVNCTNVSTTNAKRGDMFEIVGTFTAADGASLAPAYAGPFVITEDNGSGWVRMDHRKTIIPGSALDLSSLLDVPAGKYGWARNMGGRLEFENRPGVEVRLCGVNFCGEANYPETPERAAELAERMARLGYNALRIHHHDNLFARYENGVLVPIRENVERLDWLVAECVKRGIYLTTDLYVSRRVAWRDMGIDRDGDVPQGVFKAFQYATERGFRDWCDYARLFMDHVNPHTGRTYAEEPAMPLVCIQNETAFGNEWGKVMNDPALGMAAHWREFMLDARAKNPGAFPGFDPDSPPGGGMWWDDNAETAVKSAFWCWLEGRFYARAERFLREELGAKALLTGDNFGPTPALVQEMRAAQYGYCDVHLYPGAWWRWLGGSGGYTPPGLVKAHNPLTEIRAPFESAAWSRIWGVPFAVTEWDFVAPMPDRSMSGLLFGSMAAIQGWSATWRFAYEHGRNHLDDNRGAPLLYNLTRDPLALASDRATQLLFLRGDMAEAKESLSLDFGDTELDPARGRTYLSGPNWKEWFQTDLPWTRKVGVSVRGRNVPGGAPLLPRSSVTGQKETPFAVPSPRNITLDRTNGVFTVATPRTCGIFAPGGTHTAGPLMVRISATKNAKGTKGNSDLPFVDNSPTTVFVSSLDGLPLAESHRILVTHLTDAKGRGATFMDDSRLVLLRWHTPPEPDGTMPVLLREGEAEVELTLHPAEWRVWALGSDGKRECEVPCAFDPATGALHFTASVRQSFGGCMMYEIAER